MFTPLASGCKCSGRASACGWCLFRGMQSAFTCAVHSATPDYQSVEASHVAVVEHSFCLEGWQCFVSWWVVHVSAVRCPLWNSGKTKVVFLLFVSVQTRCVLLLPDLTVDFKSHSASPHRKGGGELFVCAFNVLRFICKKSTYSRLYVIPVDGILSRGFLLTALFHSRPKVYY